MNVRIDKLVDGAWIESRISEVKKGDVFLVFENGQLWRDEKFVAIDDAVCHRHSGAVESVIYKINCESEPGREMCELSLRVR